MRFGKLVILLLNFVFENTIAEKKNYNQITYGYFIVDINNYWLYWKCQHFKIIIKVDIIYNILSQIKWKKYPKMNIISMDKVLISWETSRCVSYKTKIKKEYILHDLNIRNSNILIYTLLVCSQSYHPNVPNFRYLFLTKIFIFRKKKQ